MAVVCGNLGAQVNSVDFSPDTTLVAVNGRSRRGVSGQVHVFERATGAQRIVFPCDHSVFAVRFAHNDTQCASGGSDGQVDIWDYRTGERLLQLRDPHHFAHIMLLEWSHDDRRIVTATTAVKLRVWDTASGNMLFDLRMSLAPPGRSPSPASPLVAMAFSSNDQAFVANHENGLIRTWNMVDGQEVAVLHDPADNDVCFVSFVGQDGNTILSVAQGGSVHVWSVAQQHELRRFACEVPPQCKCQCAALTDDGSCLIYAINREAAVSDVGMLDVASGKNLGYVTTNHPTHLKCIAVSRDGQWLAAGGGRQVTMWPMPDIAKLEMAWLAENPA